MDNGNFVNQLLDSYYNNKLFGVCGSVWLCERKADLILETEGYKAMKILMESNQK